MDAQSRSVIELYQLKNQSLPLDFPETAKSRDDFPPDLSSVSDCGLVQLCDALFLELDSEMPDLRAMERYQAVCDELLLRRIHSGVA